MSGWSGSPVGPGRGGLTRSGWCSRSGNGGEVRWAVGRVVAVVAVLLGGVSAVPRGTGRTPDLRHVLQAANFERRPVPVGFPAGSELTMGRAGGVLAALAVSAPVWLSAALLVPPPQGHTIVKFRDIHPETMPSSQSCPPGTGRRGVRTPTTQAVAGVRRAQCPG
jgi:hypothetical protein